MVKKIIISYFNNIAAVLNNNRIEEIIVVNQAYQVNDIYVGVVQKIFSSINAAFIKLSKYGKSGFIHINDIRPLKRSKHIYHINDILTVNQVVLVQVIKEPTFNKGPRLTANIRLHGRYLVLMPFCSTVSISYKIYDENERIYLYSLALLIRPRAMGILVKSSAEGVSERAIIQDLDLLKKQWFFIEKMASSTSSYYLIYRDEDLIKKIVRDFYDYSIKKIIVDSAGGLKKLYYYLSRCSVLTLKINTKLQFYNRSMCILEQFGIKKTIKKALKSRVKLLSGGYIVIESYEALTVIDVNSGSFNKSYNSKEAILKTNFYAAIEIAYQMRIRNINGVVIIDFIDMYSKKDQLQLLEHFNRLLKYDSAKPQIIQLSELGLVELTRRRKGQSLQELFNSMSIKCIRPLGVSRFCYESFFGALRSNSEGQLVVNKNIRSLFFGKKFTNNFIIPKKVFYFYDNSSGRCFKFLDRQHMVRLFSPKANYIVPLVFYLDLINFRYFADV
uniref:Ribonuclease E n=1 Tax=Caloglossa intermedia TaxID=100879 RepID=A0A1Z1M6J3_9FLOR|nr:ribonuclease E [Caloglossa intermedia]ARW61374.1 ribonuclease E [Caloglossa intermedia]